MNYKIAIVGILLIGFAIIGATVYIGFAVRDVEVVENAYESGLRYDEQRKVDARLGWRVEVPHEFRSGKISDLVILVRNRDGRPLSDAVVEMDLAMRGRRQNNSYRCTGGPDGRCSIRPSLEAGYWDARVRVSRNNETMVFNEIISVVR